MTINAIEPTALYEMHGESAALTLIDVREPDEFAAIRATIGANHPLSALTTGALGPIAACARNETIYVMCRSGQRSARACELLRNLGYQSVVNVTGGIQAWAAAGLPTAGATTGR